jgi:cytochrome P450
MSTPIIDEAAKVFADPTSYADEPRLHAALTHLRAHAPVSLVDCPPYRPFWAITKHADIVEIERPQHRVVRAIGADWFRPKAMRALKVHVDELAKIYVDKMEAGGGRYRVCDFVQEVAINYPLYVIMSLLGLPESDFSPDAQTHPGAVRR